MLERKIKITVETYEVLMLSDHRRFSKGLCARCRKRMTIISSNDKCGPTAGEDEANSIEETAGRSSPIGLNPTIQSERRRP